MRTEVILPDDELAALWERKVNGDLKARDTLFELYLWRAEQLAARKKVHEKIEREEMRSWAMFGLFDALRKFDPATSDGRFHRHFLSFATMRINGAILDGLKSPQVTWASRNLWRQLKLQREAEDALAQRLGRHPSTAELARHLGVDASEVIHLKTQIPAGAVMLPGGDEAISGVGAWEDPARAEDAGEFGLLCGRVAGAVAQLGDEAQAALWALLTGSRRAAPRECRDEVKQIRVLLRTI